MPAVHLAVVAEATDDDDDENLEALGREIVEELEEDSVSNDDNGMSFNFDDDNNDTVNVTGPIKGEKVQSTSKRLFLGCVIPPLAAV